MRAYLIALVLTACGASTVPVDAGGDLAGCVPCGAACVVLIADHDHCGACGSSCGPKGICVGGVCGQCINDTTYCAGACESLATDSANCGTCGNRCAAGQGCSAGTCR
jgi:hypothetical protein